LHACDFIGDFTPRAETGIGQAAFRQSGKFTTVFGDAR
jgi:hypothetical protein